MLELSLSESAARTIGESRDQRKYASPNHKAFSYVMGAYHNMLGEYDLSDEKLRDSVGILPRNPSHESAVISGESKKVIMIRKSNRSGIPYVIFGTFVQPDPI